MKQKLNIELIFKETGTIYCPHAMIYNPFQFHNGSIKTKVRWSNVSAGSEFQFHNGSIKTENFIDKYKDKVSISIPQWFN